MKTEQKKNSVGRMIGKVVGCVLGVLLLAVLCYLGYVFGTYKRIPDHQKLEIKTHGTVSEKKPEKNTEYTIAAYNVGFGAYSPDYSFFMDGGCYSRCLSKEAAITNIQNAGNSIMDRYNPEFCMFEEVDLHSTRSYHVDQDKLLSEIFDGYYETFAVNYDSAYLFYPFTEPIGKSLAGQPLYSKFSIEAAERRSLPISTSLTKVTDCDRCYSINRIPMEEGGYLCIYVIHMSAYSKDPEVKEGQVNMLLNDMGKDYADGNYVICGGDFNHDLILYDESVEGESGWTFPFPRSKFPKGIGFAFDRMSEEEIAAIGPTERDTDMEYIPGVTKTYSLDGFIISDNIELCDYFVNRTDYSYSDHEAVIMKFKCR